MVVGVASMCLTAALFLSVPELLARIYSADLPVVAAAALLLPIAGVFQVFDGIQVVASGALRGVGDTRVPMLVNLLGFWGVGLPVCLLLGFGLDQGPPGIWWGLAVGIGVVSILLMLRIRARFGRELRRIVVDDEADSPVVA